MAETSHERMGPEVDDRSVVDLIGEILNICVLNSEAAGKTLGEISTEHGHGRGISWKRFSSWTLFYDLNYLSVFIELKITPYHRKRPY